MNKKELLSFIERVEHKAITSVEKKWNKKIEEKKDEVLSKYKDKLDMYQGIFNNFSKNLTDLLTDMKEDQEVAYNCYYRIHDSLSYLSKMEKLIRDNCSFNGAVIKLRQEKDKEVEEVRFNYRKVYIVSQGMSSAKKIAEYLECLGFDLSTLKEDEMKYLSTDIDKSKLFVCGENH
ncbi:hypothetical protein [Clostridium butyricum]|uniref:hypothetical protein n=1 Tax=Clostridium butyricum TaxID=1492 RepID=UPI0034671E2D